MEELKKILLEQAVRYPKMEPTDAVKLIYQNEFGGGHLIKDPQACLNYLNQEYRQVEKDPSTPLYESIGNGIVRVNLSAVKEEDLAPLGEAFLRSAAAHKGSLPRFQEKLRLLSRLTEEGVFSFQPRELENYLDAYAASGYPAVSHSQQYRACYKPAYRVVLLTQIQ